jgi:hypothetical protein
MRLFRWDLQTRKGQKVTTTNAFFCRTRFKIHALLKRFVRASGTIEPLLCCMTRACSVLFRVMSHIDAPRYLGGCLLPILLSEFGLRRRNARPGP